MEITFHSTNGEPRDIWLSEEAFVKLARSDFPRSGPSGPPNKRLSPAPQASPRFEGEGWMDRAKNLWA